MNGKDLKPIQHNKRKVKDPARYPLVIIEIENEVKKSFDLDLNKMVVDLTKEMVNLKK